MSFDPERHFKRKAEVTLAALKYSQSKFGADNKTAIARIETALSQINAGQSVYVALAPCLDDLR